MVSEMLESLGISLLWLVIGVGLSMVLVKIYDIVVFRKFDLGEAIEGKNSAVALFFSLMMIGIGLVVAATIMSPGTGSLITDIVETIWWSISFSLVATVFFFVFDKVLVPKINLQEEISNGNMASGILSGMVYITVSLVAMAVIIT